MALTRQNGTTKSGSFRFFPANPTIDASALPASGQFTLSVTINIKDAKGNAAQGEVVKFHADKVPAWLTLPETTGITNATGNVTLTINGRISGSGENGYVHFKLVNTNNPERNGSGTIAITGSKPTGMKRLFFF